MARKPLDRPYPYRSPYDDEPPPSERELHSLHRSMQEAKAHLRAWAAGRARTDAARTCARWNAEHDAWLAEEGAGSC